MLSLFISLLFHNLNMKGFNLLTFSLNVPKGVTILFPLKVDRYLILIIVVSDSLSSISFVGSLDCGSGYLQSITFVLRFQKNC